MSGSGDAKLCGYVHISVEDGKTWRQGEHMGRPPSCFRQNECNSGVKVGPHCSLDVRDALTALLSFSFPLSQVLQFKWFKYPDQQAKSLLGLPLELFSAAKTVQAPNDRDCGPLQTTPVRQISRCYEEDRCRNPFAMSNDSNLGELIDGRNRAQNGDHRRLQAEISNTDRGRQMIREIHEGDFATGLKRQRKYEDPEDPEDPEDRLLRKFGLKADYTGGSMNEPNLGSEISLPCTDCKSLRHPQTTNAQQRDRGIVSPRQTEVVVRTNSDVRPEAG
ncbi:uncharacterized protein CLUP02_02878 [Colletotrichum lupini]|uniref:Uncharacterized protein n=1 Tax=Colletotrichum lupini TaxID=145971 RepID=A0A9Q8SI61_9PEZI|nr:uncharacterized protein CLUP02_02878 [Colletotrichum lupini]UQC77410.1 hypothetical protein CLUP02_02878 [Colletotrichum lupini]